MKQSGCLCDCEFVIHESSPDNDSVKSDYCLQDTFSVGKFFLTDFNICKSMSGPNENFPKGHTANIRCTFKVKPSMNWKDRRSGRFPNGVR